MTMTSGTRLGPYEIVAPIGAGGMGEVYRAHDTRLGRDVAIKILPPDLAQNAQFRTRFEREAKTISKLSHPNICTLFDVGEAVLGGAPAPSPASAAEGRGAPQNTMSYIVMELVEGKTLRESLESERLDLKKGLRIAHQVAEGLAAAHAAGIVHRDLKPDNIMVNASGYAKVLDFGLAKLRIQDESGDSDGARTEAKWNRPATKEGTVMGTVGYMSPEQAKGLPADARSDIFSLGCIVYEIAAGRRAFQGDSSVDTLHKIIHDEPVAFRELRPDAPAELARIVRKALAKDPDDRYQSVREMAIDLRDLLREMDSNPSLASGTAAAPAAEAPQRKMLVPAAIALAILALVAVAVALLRRPRATPAAIDAASMKITRITANGRVIDAGISPDAKFTAYVVSDQGEQTLAIRDMASGQSLTLIPARRVAYWGLAFTPDSSSLYFGIKSQAEPEGAIYQISTLGGLPRKIIETIDSQPAFSPDGKRMVFLRADFPARGQSAVMIANSDGSAARPLATVREPDFFVPIFFAGASWSPDGTMVATSVIHREGGAAELKRTARIVAIDVANGSMKTIADGGWTTVAQVAWMPDQKGLAAIVLASTSNVRSSQVWYVPYPAGEPQPVTRDLFDYRIVSLSADGKSLVTVASDATSDVWVVRDGVAPRRISASKAEGMYGVAALPDGRLVATSLETGKLDLFLMNEDGSGRMQLTRDENANRSPAVTPDGKSIVYLSTTPKGAKICRMAVDGSGRTVLATTSNPASFISITADGRSVLYEDLFSGQFGVARVPIDGGPSTRVGDEIGAPASSPDGSKLAVMLRDASGSYYLATIPAGGGPATKIMPWDVSAASMVRWTRDGKGLVVNTISGDRANLWLIPLDGGPHRKLTNFEERLIFAFAPLPDGKGWILSRGELSRDAVLITGFRPPS